ncbi:MAG: RidA family protein [Acidobacteria bacterium]|nr:RidA family protein [Acidobacteriaceae bacterium]MBV9608234.1 RidA family protein [Acidobacteriota bacterium]
MQAGAQRQYFNIGGRPADLPFSDGVLVNGTLYLSGRIGLDPKTGKAAAVPEAEAHLMLDGVRAVLERAGMGMDDLVFVQVYCTDLSLFELFNRVYQTYFSREFPARAFLGAASLVLGARFEIQAIAVKW